MEGGKTVIKGGRKRLAEEGRKNCGVREKRG